jgi:hypothetical protein
VNISKNIWLQRFYVENFVGMRVIKIFIWNFQNISGLCPVRALSLRSFDSLTIRQQARVVHEQNTDYCSKYKLQAQFERVKLRIDSELTLNRFN